YRIVRAYLRTLFEQAANDADCGRFAHVVRLGLESETKHGHRLVLKCTNELTDLRQHHLALPLVYFNDCIDDPRLGVVLSSHGRKGARVFGEARTTKAWSRMQKLTS